MSLTDSGMPCVTRALPVVKTAVTIMPGSHRYVGDGSSGGCLPLRLSF